MTTTSMTTTSPATLLSRAAVSAEPLAPWCGVAASVTLAAVDLLLAIITPEYDAIGETISEMHSVDMAYSTVARLSLLIYCALAVPFTIRASHMPELSSPWARYMSFGLWLHIIMGVIAAVFQADSPDEVLLGLTANNLHDGAGHLFYVAGLTGVIGAVMAMDDDPSTRRLFVVSVIVAFIMVQVGLVFVTRVADALTGLEERVGFAAYLLWVTMMSLRIRATRRRMQLT